MRRLAGGCPIKWLLFLVVLSKHQSTVKIIKTFFYSLLSKLQLECSKYAEFMFN